jgi:hypothetical protein
MSDTNQNTSSLGLSTGANGPISVDKLKEYRKKAYAPLLDVVMKYQNEFTPYLQALNKGLQGGYKSLSQESSSEAEKYVAHFFQEAADACQVACDKIVAKDLDALTEFLGQQAEKRPGVMFGTSYIAGVLFGRLGRHLASSQDNVPQEMINSEPPSFDESIH